MRISASMPILKNSDKGYRFACFQAWMKPELEDQEMYLLTMFLLK